MEQLETSAAAHEGATAETEPPKELPKETPAEAEQEGAAH